MVSMGRIQKPYLAKTLIETDAHYVSMLCLFISTYIWIPLKLFLLTAFQNQVCGESYILPLVISVSFYGEANCTVKTVLFKALV